MQQTENLVTQKIIHSLKVCVGGRTAVWLTPQMPSFFCFVLFCFVWGKSLTGLAWSSPSRLVWLASEWAQVSLLIWHTLTSWATARPLLLVHLRADSYVLAGLSLASGSTLPSAPWSVVTDVCPHSWGHLWMVFLITHFPHWCSIFVCSLVNLHFISGGK